MTWKRIVSLEIVAIFLKKVSNNTPVHIVDVLAEDLSFCRGVMGGGYTANNQTYAFKTYTRHTKRSEKRKREREIEKQKPGKSGDTWVCLYFKN